MADLTSQIDRIRLRLRDGERNVRIDSDHQFTAFEKQETDQSIPDRFIKQVKAYPDNIAVKTEKESLTYSELNRASSRLANTIVSEFGRKAEPISLLISQKSLLITSMLATLKAGKFYIPLDPAHIDKRNEQILIYCGARLLITDKASLSLAKSLSSRDTKILVADEVEWSDSVEDPAVEIAPDSFAYILYTSGSTGKPKGVIQTHRTLLHNIMKYTNGIHISADDRISLTASPGFGASVSDIYGALLNGASLFPFDLKGDGLVRLVDWLKDEQITIFHSVPSVFRYLAARLADRSATLSLRMIKLGGEPVYGRDIKLYRKYFPDDCILHIGLGASEMNIIRQFFLDKQSAFNESIVPVGYEVDECEILLLDESGSPALPDATGEIAIRSRFQPAGYWRDPEATAMALRPDPDSGGLRIYLTGDIGYLFPDGCLLHLGRKDSQVKIRGRKVELAEVEVSLLNIKGIKEASVRAEQDKRGNCALAAYVVAESGVSLSASQLRYQLKETLPEYMVPPSIEILEELPRTPGGKVDYENLASRPVARRGATSQIYAPRNQIEERLVRLWEEALNTKPVGIRDDFFDLGGDSLSAAELFVGIEKFFGRTFPASTLLQSPTIERLAKLIEDQSEESSLVPLRVSGENPPLFCVHGIGGDVLSFRSLAIHLGEDQPVYGLRAMDGNVDRFSVEQIAARYIDAMKSAQPEGPFFLAGYSFGGTVAFEMARQLIEEAEQVRLLALFDTYGPGYPALLPIRARLLIHLKNLIRADRERKLEYIRERVKTNTVRIRKLARRVFYLINKRVRREPPAFIQNNTQAAHQQALREYVPKCVDVRITLFRAQKQGEVWRKDLYLGWSGLAARGIEVHDVPGDHLTLIAEPEVRVLAEKLRECLLRASSGR